MTNTLNSALHYALEFGWPVFPVHNAHDGVCTCRKRDRCPNPAKHPRTQHGLKDATTNENKIRVWWDRWPDANVAIRTGEASDVVVIDVDPRHDGDNSLQVMLGRLGLLPEHPVTTTGGGGNHRLFKHPGGRLPSRQDILTGIDVRADGGYIVAPRSVHETGAQYRWQIDPETVAPPILPWKWVDFLATPTSHRHTGHIEGSGEGLWGSLSADEAVEKAILATMPTGPGQRHGLLFKYARFLKSYPTFANAPVRALKPYVGLWYRRAKRFTKTKPFEDFWFDFAEGWDKVKSPIGAGLMTDVISRAISAETPIRAQHEYRQAKVHLLVRICRELQRNAGSEPFFLSVRNAGEAVDISPRQAATWLNGLVVDGYLERAGSADRHRRQAARFRYVEDD